MRSWIPTPHSTLDHRLIIARAAAQIKCGHTFARARTSHLIFCGHLQLLATISQSIACSTQSATKIGLCYAYWIIESPHPCEEKRDEIQKRKRFSCSELAIRLLPASAFSFAAFLTALQWNYASQPMHADRLLVLYESNRKLENGLGNGVGCSTTSIVRRPGRDTRSTLF